MRKGILGSIAALAAGAGAAWGQMPSAPTDPPPPAALGPAAVDPGVIPANGPLLPPGLAKPGPAPVIMPPIAVGPQGDPQGLGPVGGFGPPPGPMYPPPGAYAAPLWQPAAPGVHGGGVPAGYPGAAPHVWTTVDYLLYFAKAQPIRFPLVTTSAPSDLGLLGRPSTLVLVGQDDLSYNPISGFRITSGFFGDCDRRFGAEASGFLLEQKTNITDIASAPANIPTLARPFLDSINPNAASSLVIANPGFATGRIIVKTSSQTWGVEGNAVWNIFRSDPESKCGCSLDFLAGYRYLQVQEDLDIASVTNLNVPSVLVPQFVVGPFGVITQVGTIAVPVPVGFGGLTVFSPSAIEVRDVFKTTNQFNGGQVGLRGEVRSGMFVFAMSSKLAIGHMHQTLEITGLSGFNNPTIANGVGTAYGGLLANATNIGRFNHDEFAVIPEVNASLGIHITRGLTGFIGYNFLYINRVARPGTQINPIVDTSTVPFSPNYGATNRPASFREGFTQDDFWLMGINFGLRLQY